MKFKVGDKVKCIRRIGYQLTRIGSVYTVDGYRENGDVMFKELPRCAYNSNDFILVTKKTFFKKLPNDYTGTLEIENGYIVEKEILDEEEKEYLLNIIKPFRDKVEYISKNRFSVEEFISITIANDSQIQLPNFEKNTMYKGMKVYKKYTLKELGLDE